jgi:uncharacterized membrane protein YczE
VGIFNLAAFGVDPFQCFAQGSYLVLSDYFQYGTYYFLISLLMLIGIWIWDKHYIGLATFINMFLTGYIVSYSYKLLANIFPSPALLQRIIMLATAVIIMCFGSALYYTADLGVSVYDAVSLILAKKKIKILKYILPFKWIRVLNDLICVGIGTLFGKSPGIGTIITAFFMGPLISFFNHNVAEPFLNEKNNKE